VCEIVTDKWPSLYLLVFPMRGHVHPPDPFTITPEQLELEIALRFRPTPWGRSCSPDLAVIIRAVVIWACEKRGGVCREVIVARTCTFAIVELSYWSSVDGLLDAIRLVVARKARRQSGWPVTERVFSKHPRYRELGLDERGVKLGEHAPGIARL